MKGCALTDLAMAPIFPVTVLSKDSKEVRDAARTSPVRITENGRGAYVFTSEGVLSDLVRREREVAGPSVECACRGAFGCRRSSCGRGHCRGMRPEWVLS